MAKFANGNSHQTSIGMLLFEAFQARSVNRLWDWAGFGCTVTQEDPSNLTLA